MHVIGIAGGTGSGKTTLVNKIKEHKKGQQITFVHQDSYYRDNSHIPLEKREDINFDHPQSIEFELLVEHVRALKAGKPVHQPTYSYITCTRQEKVIYTEPNPVIIVEGILIFTFEPLVELMDTRVFIETGNSERLARIIRRDVDERGRTEAMVRERYEKIVKPMHEKFVEPSKKHADTVIPGGGSDEKSLAALMNSIDKITG